jgi:hypothetical protein
MAGWRIFNGPNSVVIHSCQVIKQFKSRFHYCTWKLKKRSRLYGERVTITRPSVRPSVCTHKQTPEPLTEFSWNMIPVRFKMCSNILISVQIGRKILERTNSLLSFHCNLRIWYDKGKTTLIYTCNEINKTIKFERMWHWCYWSEWFMKHVVEMASDGTYVSTKFHEDWFGHTGDI